MSRQCTTCMFRATDNTRLSGSPGCSYLLLTGHSRLKQVYKRLRVNRVTDKVREAMRPENCVFYRRGDKLVLPDEGQILLAGSIPIQRRLDKDQARKLYNRGLNDKEISDVMGCAHETVRRWRVAEGLPHNYRQGKQQEAPDGAV